MTRLFLTLAAFALAILAQPARAELLFCNEMTNDAVIAIGYKGDEDWTSEGWWTIDAGNCAMILGGDLKKRYYYWHAITSDGPLPSGNYVFCTSNEAFTIVGDEHCENRGYERTRFSIVDTGSAKSYTVSITGNTASSASEGRPGSNTGASNLTTMSVIFSHCDTTSVILQCMFNANRRRYIVSSAEETPAAIMDQLENTPPLTPINVTFATTSRSEAADTIVIHDLSRGQQDRFAGIREALQGSWQDSLNVDFEMSIHGTTLRDVYLKLDSMMAFWEIADTCEGANGAGPVMLVTYYDPPPAETSCWVLRYIDDSRLAFRAISGTKVQLFSKVD